MDYNKPSLKTFIPNARARSIFWVLAGVLLSIPQLSAQVDTRTSELSHMALPITLAQQDLQDINGTWSRLVDRMCTVLERAHGALVNGLIIPIMRREDIIDATKQIQFEQAVQQIKASTEFLGTIKRELQRYQQELFIPTHQEIINRVDVLAHAIQVVRTGMDQKFTDLPALEMLIEQPIELPQTMAQILEYLAVTLHKDVQQLDTMLDRLGSNRFQRAMRTVDSLLLQRIPWKMVGTVGAIALAGYGLQKALKWQFETQASDPKLAGPDPDKTAYRESLLRQSLTVFVPYYLLDKFTGSLISMISPESPQNIFARIAGDAISNTFTHTYQSISQQVSHYYAKTRVYAYELYQSKILGQNPHQQAYNLHDRMITLDSPELIGLEQVRKTLGNVLHFLLNADAMLRAGQNMPRTLLLTGPSSCGKSLSIKALINTLEKEFLMNNKGKKVNYRVIDPSEVEAGSSRRFGTLDMEITRAMFYSNGPTIIFIDEIHLLNLRQDTNPALLAEFLDRLRKLEDINDPDKIVIIIAATNKKDMLAPELRMHGRFSTQVEFKLPGHTERQHYFTHFLKELGGIELDARDIEKFVLLTYGCNYGHLEDIIRAAKLTASRAGRGVVANDIETEIYTKVFGLLDISLQSIRQIGISEQELATVAAHQAGKLVGHHLMKPQISCVFASVCRVRDPLRASAPWMEYMFSSGKDDKALSGITSKNMSYGICAFIDSCEEVRITSRQEYLKRIKILLAGQAAQDILIPEGVSVYGQQDRDEALSLLKNLHLAGIKPDSISQTQLDEYCARALQQLLVLEEEIKAELLAHRELLVHAHQKLLTQAIVTPADVVNS